MDNKTVHSGGDWRGPLMVTYLRRILDTYDQIYQRGDTTVTKAELHIVLEEVRRDVLTSYQIAQKLFPKPLSQVIQED
jgi:hypothetical protein